MNKSVYLAAGLLLLSLTGCSAAAGELQGVVPFAATSEETSAPVETQTPEATVWPYTLMDNADSVFLGAMRGGATYGMENVSDADLIALGYQACQIIADTGVSTDDIEFIDDDPVAAGAPYANYNDINIAGIASETFCREFNHISE